MIQLQVISYILQTHSLDILDEGGIERDYFIGYTDEYDFIINHNLTYGNVPDVATFISKFNDFEILEVSESKEYLINELRELYQYQVLSKNLQEVANKTAIDSYEGIEYLNELVTKFTPKTVKYVDIVKQAGSRLDHYKEVKERQDKWFIPTGFEELDEVIHGFQRGEEFAVLVARLNQGKSWVLVKMCTHIWEIGFNVGFISPEMSAISLGYRFDTLYSNFSNSALMWGKDELDEEAYKKHVDNLESKDNKFIVSTPSDFGNHITVSKLKSFCKQLKLDFLAIDGIKYLSDERGRRGDNVTTSLTNISEDLMSLSIELGIPIVTVVQANRDAVSKDNKDSLPELESIRDSDGIAHSASKVISVRQTKDGKLDLGVKKNRFGPVGVKVSYLWNIDKGEFVFVPNEDKEETLVDRPSKQSRRTEVKEASDVF